MGREPEAVIFDYYKTLVELSESARGRFFDDLARSVGIRLPPGEPYRHWLVRTDRKLRLGGRQRAFAEHNAGVGAALAPPQGAASDAPTPLEPLHIRVGLNAGEPIAEEDDLFGMAVIIMAERICSKAAWPIGPGGDRCGHCDTTV